jgi:hypothetical protein
LTKPSDAKDIWSGVQYHDPKSDSGVVQVFRREDSPYTEAHFKLCGISCEDTYTFEDADGGEFTVEGSVLAEKGFRVEIAEVRAAKVYFYKKNI